MESQNSYAVLIDQRGFDAYRVVESEHPYVSAFPTDGVAYIIVSETVDGGEDCLAWNLHFDADTETYFTDRVTIYDDNVNRNVIFSAGTDWPGTNLPSLRVARSSFYVEFAGPTTSQFEPATINMNLYGFKLYCAPVYAQAVNTVAAAVSTATERTVIQGNFAPSRYLIAGATREVFMIILNCFLSHALFV